MEYMKSTISIIIHTFNPNSLSAENSYTSKIEKSWTMFNPGSDDKKHIAHV